MRACAPGKLVLSGAYSVLEGAPAIVSAVDRYVYCDTERTAELVTPEVRLAIPAGPIPHFDARELRADGRKLGLGSSAAILVASLAAANLPRFETDEALRRAIEAPALAAHREAQGGGSGIDVAASIWGGTLIARRSAPTVLAIERVSLPPDLVVEIWASGTAASTPELLAAVARFRADAPAEHAAILAHLRAASERAADALKSGHTPALVAALRAQREGLDALGEASRVPIVTPAVKSLALLACSQRGAVIPSGAGGGDIVLWLSDRSSSTEFRDLASRLGHHQIEVALHARGVHRCSLESTPQRVS